MANRRIGGARGGSDPGKGKKHSAGVVVGTVLGVSALGGGIGSTSAIGGAESAVGSIGGPGANASFQAQTGRRALRELRTRTDRAVSSAKKGATRKAWHRMRLRRSTKRHVQNATQCVAFSHGQVRQFFVHTPCRALRREFVGLVDADGNMIAVSVVRITMRNYHDVRSLRALIDVQGTGDVYPLGSSVLGLGDVHFTGKHYKSRKVGRSLVVAEAEPVSGSPSTAFLDSVATVAVWLPKR